MREGCYNSQRKEEPQGRERGVPETQRERERERNVKQRERRETEREREWRTYVREIIK